jgi:hypothetical protein
VKLQRHGVHLAFIHAYSVTNHMPQHSVISLIVMTWTRLVQRFNLCNEKSILIHRQRDSGTLNDTSSAHKAGNTLSSRHVSSCDVHAYSWNVRGDLALNSMAQIHTSVTLLTSRDLAWSFGRLMCQHASQICTVAHISWDVTAWRAFFRLYQSFSEMEEILIEKVRQRAFLYDTKSPDYRDQYMRANAWERIGKEFKIKRKFYVISRDVRIVCPRLNSRGS